MNEALSGANVEQNSVVISDGSVALFKSYRELITKQKSPHDDHYWRNVIANKVIEIGKKGLAVKHYRCIREGRFAESRMAQHPRYLKDISGNNQLSNLKIIDIGCCFGSDIRRLLVDGADLNNLTGLDQFQDYWNQGLELFDDLEHKTELSKAKTFISASILRDDFYDNLQAHLGYDPKESYDIVYMGSVLHLLQESEVHTAIRVASGLLRKGGVYFGGTVGSIPAGIARREGELSPSEKEDQNVLRYLNSPETLTETMKSNGFQDITVQFTERMPVASSSPAENRRVGKWGFMYFFGQKS